MKSDRRSFLIRAMVAATTMILGGARAIAQPRARRVFTPEMFGAKGDGITNDSSAMAALAAAVNANGGGTVRFRRTTYLVGAQVPAPDPGAAYLFEPPPLLEFSGCRAPLRILGNGARLKCDGRLRYGAFTRDGAPARHKMPYIGPGLATPYRHMIRAHQCSGSVEVADFELDGNVGELIIGGGYGDTGWQIPAIGLALTNNSGSETVRNVHCHHHAQDGLYIDGVDAPPARGVVRRIKRVRSLYNGRQGCSIVGGQAYAFEHCEFSHTGKSKVASAPGAGVDIEAEGGKKNRDLSFSDCRFADNSGCGMVADTGDSEGVTFTRCTFVGTTSWSAWPCKPRFRFQECVFVGAMTRAFGDADPERAARFLDCSFTDDPALSPTGAIYGGGNSSRPLADLSDAANMQFSRCTFLARHSMVLPWSVNAIYADCRMEQRPKEYSFPRGIFLGRTTISGNANLTGSRVVGEVVVNDKVYGPGRL